jgi:hypothetical protein
VTWIGSSAFVIFNAMSVAPVVLPFEKFAKFLFFLRLSPLRAVAHVMPRAQCTTSTALSTPTSASHCRMWRRVFITQSP